MVSRQSCTPKAVEILQLSGKAGWKRFDKLMEVGETYAIDFETNGLDATASDFRLLGMGIANNCFSIYVDFRNIDDDNIRAALWVLGQCRLIAHNAMFDGACMYRYLNSWPNFIGCTLIFFKMLAAEGWTGQRWGLDVAIDDVLGWDVSNKDTLKELLDRHKLAKSDMWKLADLEPVAFAEYCGADADACWQLWQYFQTVNESVTEWHKQAFMPQIGLLVEQQFRGMMIDVDGLLKHKAKLQVRIVRKEQEFLKHTLVAPHV